MIPQGQSLCAISAGAEVPFLMVHKFCLTLPQEVSDVNNFL